MKKPRRRKNSHKNHRAGKKRRALKPNSLKTFRTPPSDDVVFQVVQSPFAKLTDDERAKVIKDTGERASSSFLEATAKLQELTKTYDPLVFLAILAAYGTMAGIEDDGSQRPLLGDELGQTHVELYQALTLQIPLSDNSRAPAKPQTIEDAFTFLSQASNSFAYKRLADADLNASEENIAIRQIQEFVRQKTQIVRNWGFFNQVYFILEEIFSSLDSKYKQYLGFNATTVLKMFAHVLSTIEERGNKRIATLAELYAIKDKNLLVYKYHELLGLEKSIADQFIQGLNIEARSIKEVFSMVQSHYDILIYPDYIFSVQELAQVLDVSEDSIEKIFNEFSFEFGALSATKTEHIFLANPIWHRPLIRIDKNSVFCPLPQMFFSFALNSMDALLSKHESNLMADHRSDYLEKKVEDIVKTRFPHAHTIRGLKWKLDDIEYETDLITFIDSHIVIIEAKSGKISDTALRGAPDRLKKHVQDILIEPNVQSMRLKNLLLDLVNDPTLQHPIRTKLPVDLKNIHRVVRISVSLEDFASLQANVYELKKTGWLPEDFEPCPTVCLGDFQTIFDILEHPVQIIHYLYRREFLEANVRYLGDELDLLGWYINTLFNLPNFGDEFNRIVISGFSSVLDKYYTGLTLGLPVIKPKPKLHPFFEKVFLQLESRQTPRWTEIGIILHMFMPSDQTNLVKLLVGLKRNVEKNWHKLEHENMLILNPASPSEIAICYILYKNENAHRRNEFIQQGSLQALQPNHVRYCLVIAKNIDDNTFAYDFIALAEKSLPD